MDEKILRAVEPTPQCPTPHCDFIFWCPACQCGHGVWTTNANGHTGAKWRFNGNMDKPTFEPSLKITSETHVPPVTSENLEEFKKAPWPQTKQTHTCHLLVIDGHLHFCPDCTHELAGKVIPMVPF